MPLDESLSIMKIVNTIFGDSASEACSSSVAITSSESHEDKTPAQASVNTQHSSKCLIIRNASMVFLNMGYRSISSITIRHELIMITVFTHLSLSSRKKVIEYSSCRSRYSWSVMSPL